MSVRNLTVVVVDDDSIVRDWLVQLLAETEFRVVGEAATAADARNLVPRRLPDLLLVDYRLPDALGTDLVRELRAQREQMRALLMTANAEPGLNEAARVAGAQGSALKTGRGSELLAALRAVATGAVVVDPRHPRRPNGLARLSTREREILRRVAAGQTNREIAEALEIGTETVKTLLARTFAKLGVRRRAEAVSLAQRDRLL